MIDLRMLSRSDHFKFQHSHYITLSMYATKLGTKIIYFTFANIFMTSSTFLTTHLLRGLTCFINTPVVRLIVSDERHVLAACRPA